MTARAVSIKGNRAQSITAVADIGAELDRLTVDTAHRISWPQLVRGLFCALCNDLELTA